MLNEMLSKAGNQKYCPIVVIIKNDSLLMGHRHYGDKWKNKSVWTVPGGRCEVGEMLEEALRRETKEETGIKDLVIHDFIAEVPGAKEGDKVFIFYATTKADPQLMEPEKFSEWKWVPLMEEYGPNAESAFNSSARIAIKSYLTAHNMLG